MTHTSTVLPQGVDDGDKNQRACADVLESHPGPLLVPALCVAEVSHIVGGRRGSEAEVRLLLAMAGGELEIEPVEPADLERTAELVAIYRDLPLGTVDASVVAAAERLGVTRIATLDRRDFGVVRPAHVDAFELVP